MAKTASRTKGVGFGKINDWFGWHRNSSNKDTANWARKYLSKNGADASLLDSLSDDELADLLFENYGTGKSYGGIFGGKGTEVTTSGLEALLNDLTELQGLQLTRPDDIDLESVYADAESNVQKDIDNTLALYDADLQRQTKLYNDNMNNLNAMYNQNANAILANDYRNNAALLGSVNSSMSRARQSALEAGASAGIRLASNVNTLLSIQNKQAQTSLDTSNQLAQAMLNQRQASMSLKNDYSDVLSSDTNKRASLENGRYERMQAAKDTAGNLATNVYNNKLDAYNNNLAAVRENNALADYWAANKQVNKLKSNTNVNNQGY